MKKLTVTQLQWLKIAMAIAITAMAVLAYVAKSP